MTYSSEILINTTIHFWFIFYQWSNDDNNFDVSYLNLKNERWYFSCFTNLATDANRIVDSGNSQQNIIYRVVDNFKFILIGFNILKAVFYK